MNWSTTAPVQKTSPPVSHRLASFLPPGSGRPVAAATFWFRYASPMEPGPPLKTFPGESAPVRAYQHTFQLWQGTRWGVCELPGARSHARLWIPVGTKYITANGPLRVVGEPI